MIPIWFLKYLGKFSPTFIIKTQYQIFCLLFYHSQVYEVWNFFLSCINLQLDDTITDSRHVARNWRFNKQKWRDWTQTHWSTNPNVWYHRCWGPSWTEDACGSPTWSLDGGSWAKSITAMVLKTPLTLIKLVVKKHHLKELSKHNSPIEWAFFIALEISFCFLPQRPAK